MEKKKARDLKPGDKITLNGVTGAVARIAIDPHYTDGHVLLELEPMPWEKIHKMRGDKILSAEDQMKNLAEFLGVNLGKRG